MNNHQANILNQQLAESFLFTPYLGTNVSLCSDRWGYWQGASGYCNPQTRVPIPQNQQFYLYSITKTFTAVTILKMVENRQISLEEKVSKILPTIKLSEVMTIRHLLNHTSGLFNYTELEAYEPSVQEHPETPWPETDMIDLIESRELDFEPGTSWHYSNTGYFVLKKIIETLTQKSYKEAIRRYITDPFDLEQTEVVENIPGKTLTPGYSRDLDSKRRITQVSEQYHPGWCHTGLIMSTAPETASFYHQLFTKKRLPSHLLQELCQPIEITTKDPRFGRSCYGLGIMIDPESPYGMMYGHGGEGPGYNPWVMHLPDFQGAPLTLAVLTNFNAGAIPLLLIHDLLAQVAMF